MWRDSRGVERLLLAVAAGLITFSALQLGPLTASRPAPDRSPRQVNVDSGQVDLTESTGLELPVAHVAAWVDPLNGTCRPVNSYVFVKTHKTGGSTLANVLHRRTWKHQLKPVLPKNLVNMGWPNRLTPKSVLKGPSTVAVKGDVLTGHLVFDDVARAATARMIPKGRYLTILRDPITRLLSAFKYYGIARMVTRGLAKRVASGTASTTLAPLPVGDPAAAVRQFAARAAEYMSLSPEINPAGRPNVTLVHALVKDSMAFDLGFTSTYSVALEVDGARWTSLVELEVQRAAEKFDLVLINEYWDESMVLLRRAFCWELDDVVYTSLKAAAALSRGPPAAKPSRGSQLQRSLPPETLRDLNKLVKLDTALYRHFNRTFWQRIAAEVGFDEEVAALRRRVSEVQAQCATYKVGIDLGRTAPHVCQQHSWENVKFSCELAKQWGQLPQGHQCKECVFGSECGDGRRTSRNLPRYTLQHAP